MRGRRGRMVAKFASGVGFVFQEFDTKWQVSWPCTFGKANLLLLLHQITQFLAYNFVDEIL